MVFYIVACNEENKTEEQILRKIQNEVLVDKSRSLGTVHHYSNEKVSYIISTTHIIDFLFRLRKHPLRLDLWIN